MGASFDMVEAGMNIHQLPVKDALKGLRSTANGLSSVAALQRLGDFGPNRMETVAGMPPVLRLLKEFVQFFSVILWIAAALAFVAEWSAPGQGMARIGFAIITVILVSGAFSFWQEHRVEQTLEALQKLLPPQVNCCATDRSFAWAWTSWCRATSFCSSKATSFRRTAA